MKSWAGLDNIYVLKGHQNFANMQTMVTTSAGIIQNDIDNTRKHLEDEIDWVESFHKVGFREHIGVGTCKCTCIKCGFHSTIDPITCENRQTHTPPCKDCQQTFKVSISWNRIVYICIC